MSGLPLGLGRALFRNIIPRHSQFISLSMSFQSHVFFGLKHIFSLPLCYRGGAGGGSFVSMDLKEEVQIGRQNNFCLRILFFWKHKIQWGHWSDCMALKRRMESCVKCFIHLNLQVRLNQLCPFFSYSDLGLYSSFCLHKYSSVERHCESSCCLCLPVLLGTFRVGCIFVSLLI